MGPEVENLALKQLRLIRGDIAVVKDRFEPVETKLDGLAGIVIGLGKYVHDLDDCMLAVEEKLGD